jgi:hypothetical protein
MWHEPHENADQKRRLDRAVSEMTHARVSRRGIGGFAFVEAFPARERLIDLHPALLVEARIGKLAKAERAGGSAEGEIAIRLALILALVVRIVGVGGCILEVARRIAIADLADVLQQLVIAGTPVEAISLFQLLCGTALAAGYAATGIVDQTVRGKAIVPAGRLEHAEPVDQHAHALLEHIRMKACVAGRRLYQISRPARSEALSGASPRRKPESS